MKLRTYDELLIEIERVKKAISATKSIFAKKDYKKHLERLLKDKNYYERTNAKWNKSHCGN